MKNKIKPYIVSIAIALAVGGVSAFLTRDSMNIYSDIKTPPLSPPAILFPIVWTILFVLMGISAAIVYTSENSEPSKRSKALKVYAASLVVNFLWSIVFFNFRAFLTSVVILLLLIFLILKTISLYRPINSAAAYLQIPYALWVSFALYLNIAIWLLNK